MLLYDCYGDRDFPRSAMIEQKHSQVMRVRVIDPAVLRPFPQFRFVQ